MAVPWSVLVSTLPTLIESAGKLFKKTEAHAPLPPASGPVESRIDALSRRLADCESVATEQALLLKQALEQLEQMALRSKAAERRAYVAIALALASLAVAGVAVFLP